MVSTGSKYYSTESFVRGFFDPPGPYECLPSGGATKSKYFLGKASPFSADCTTFPGNRPKCVMRGFGESVVQLGIEAPLWCN